MWNKREGKTESGGEWGRQVGGEGRGRGGGGGGGGGGKKGGGGDGGGGGTEHRKKLSHLHKSHVCVIA